MRVCEAPFHLIKYWRWKRHLKKSDVIKKRAGCANCTWTVFDNKLYLLTCCQDCYANQWWLYSPSLIGIDKDITVLRQV